MKQNIKITNNVKIGIGLLLSVVILILIVIFLVNDDKGNQIDGGVKSFEEEVIMYNNILRNSTSLKDVKKCGKLYIEDVKKVCESSIQVKFGDMSKAETLEDCEKLEATETEAQGFRVDVCKYNLIKKMNEKDLDYRKLCGQIINTDIRSSCLFETKVN